MAGSAVLYCTALPPTPDIRLGGMAPPRYCYCNLVANTRNLFKRVPLKPPGSDIWWWQLKHTRFASGWYESSWSAFLFIYSVRSQWEKNSKGISHCNLVLTVTAVTELFVTAVNGFGARICSFWLDVLSNQQKPVKNPSWLPAYSNHVTNLTD